MQKLLMRVMMKLPKMGIILVKYQRRRKRDDKSVMHRDRFFGFSSIKADNGIRWSLHAHSISPLLLVFFQDALNICASKCMLKIRYGFKMHCYSYIYSARMIPYIFHAKVQEYFLNVPKFSRLKRLHVIQGEQSKTVMKKWGEGRMKNEKLRSACWLVYLYLCMIFLMLSSSFKNLNVFYLGRRGQSSKG